MATMTAGTIISIEDAGAERGWKKHLKEVCAGSVATSCLLGLTALGTPTCPGLETGDDLSVTPFLGPCVSSIKKK